MKLSRRGKSARRGRHTKRAGKHLRYRGKKVRGSKRYHLGHKRTHKRGRRLQRGGGESIEKRLRALNFSPEYNLVGIFTLQIKYQGSTMDKKFKVYQDGSGRGFAYFFGLCEGNETDYDMEYSRFKTMLTTLPFVSPNIIKIGTNYVASSQEATFSDTDENKKALVEIKRVIDKPE